MNVIGFDDGPFRREHRGDVVLVGAVCAKTRLDGVVCGHVRRDGTDSTRRMIALVEHSQFNGHVRAVLLQGIAVAGFNVVDVHELSRALRVPVLVVSRKMPDFEAIGRALFSDDPPFRPRVRGAARKWKLIESAGAVEPLCATYRAGTRPSGLKGSLQRLWVQRVGLSMEAALKLISETTLHGNVPEPLRLAHLIAGARATGKSRGRA